jgi:hypothetical protein
VDIYFHVLLLSGGFIAGAMCGAMFLAARKSPCALRVSRDGAAPSAEAKSADTSARSSSESEGPEEQHELA